jgi:hypothetical protein
VELRKIQPEFYVENPNHKSINELKERKLMEARQSVGLLPRFLDIKDGSKDPTVKFVENPQIISRSEMALQRRKENFEEFKKTEAI